MMESGGGWSCASGCNSSEPNYRYIMSCRIQVRGGGVRRAAWLLAAKDDAALPRHCSQDHTGSAFVTLFDDQAKELIGRSAGELRAMTTVGGGTPEPTPEFDAAVRGILHKDLYLWLSVKVRGGRAGGS